MSHECPRGVPGVSRGCPGGVPGGVPFWVVQGKPFGIKGLPGDLGRDPGAVRKKGFSKSRAGGMIPGAILLHRCNAGVNGKLIMENG